MSEEQRKCELCVFYIAGADGGSPPGGGAGHPHPEALCWNQLPLRRHHGGGHEHTAGGAAAVRAGTAPFNTAQHSPPPVPVPHWLLCVRLQGLELCRVIAMQVENMMLVRDKRLTMPPSEITML